MEREVIYKTIIKQVHELLPEIPLGDITPEASLKDLGANSVDRMDILVSTMQALEVKIPMIRFAKASNIHDIIDIFHKGN